MSKLNWSCSSCGMSSARRTSVRRHIDNPNIHGGKAIAVTFTEYSAGIIIGKYKIGQKPSFGSLEKPLLVRLLRKIMLEVENEIAREVAKRICNTMHSSFYNYIQGIARNEIFFKQFKETFGQEL